MKTHIIKDGLTEDDPKEDETTGQGIAQTAQELKLRQALYEDVLNVCLTFKDKFAPIEQGAAVILMLMDFALLKRGHVLLHEKIFAVSEELDRILNDLTRDLPETDKVMRSGSTGTIEFTVPMNSNDVVLVKAKRS